MNQPSKGPAHRRGYVLNALAFSTLLSSQETDAHHQQPHGRLQGNYSNLPDQPHPVNPGSEDFWETRKFGHHQHRLPDALSWRRKIISSLLLRVSLWASGSPSG